MRSAAPLVLCLCLDEIFFRRHPVLMGVEPHSLAWVLGERAADRSGATWARALPAGPEGEDVAADGGRGIERGLELVTVRRQQAALAVGGQAKPFRARLDTFHLRRDGARALRVEWGHAEAVGEEAEKVERAKARHDRSGRDRRQFKRNVPQKGWLAAEAAFAQACCKERARGRAGAALRVLRPDGRLRDRSWAEAELRAAAAELTGAQGAKVRRQLLDPRSLTFLDRLHEGLAAAEPCSERREALVALWRWRQAPRGGEEVDGQEAGPGVGQTAAELLRARLGPGGEASAARVSRVLGGWCVRAAR